MTKPFATGKHALAMCDRCGLQVSYIELKTQIINLKPTGLRVCAECLDQDHPQYQVGLWPVNDPQALENPRPDQDNDGTVDPYVPPVINSP